MPYIRKRQTKDNSPCYQVVIEMPPDVKTGKRNRIYRTVHGTKKQAEHIMNEMIYELNNQMYIEPQKITVGEWVEEWYKTYIEKFKSKSTLRGYKYNIDNYIIPMLGNCRLQDLSSAKIQQWINELSAKSPVSGKPMSAKSVRNVALNLQSALGKAVDLDMIKKNPCRKVTFPKIQKHEVDVYDEDEVAKLIDCAKNSDMELPIMLALTLGLRRGELIALRWSNVDMKNDVIHITENRVEGIDGKVVTKQPKSEAGIRDIPISPSLKKLLQTHHVKFLEKKLMYRLGDKEDFVISQKDGKPYVPYSMTKKFREFLEKNGLRHIRLHDLRHTNASIMLQQGISPKVAQQRLGHSDFAITMNVYSHVMKSVEVDAANKLDEALFKQA